MVRNGIDCIEKYENIFKKRRLGLITSISAVDLNMTSTIDLLHRRYGLTALFSPEHGVRGNQDAGDMVEAYTDIYTGLPVYSLYRKDSKRLTDEMLDLIDTLVYDIQDVGVRYYTFISNMYYAMQECNRRKKEMILLDRCNPLGGMVEGNLLKPSYESFIGAYPLCMRYGLTIGELAGMIYKEQNYDFPLQIIRLEGWRRFMLFPQTGNIWVMPSLGLPNFETAFLYAGTCLFEGTNLSEGRGTSVPFQMIGAPYLDGYELAKSMNRKGLRGVCFSPAYFKPTASKYVQKECQGVHIHVTDYRVCRPIETAVALLCEIRDKYEDEFAYLVPWRKGGKHSIELLFGNASILNKDFTVQEFAEQSRADSDLFKKRCMPYYLYENAE